MRVRKPLWVMATVGGFLFASVGALEIRDPGILTSTTNPISKVNARTTELVREHPSAVAALGRIEPQSEIINLSASSASPDRLESLFVERGDRVKKDQVLGYLAEYYEQDAQIEVFQAQLEEAKKKLATEWEADLARIEVAEIHKRQVREVWPVGDRGE